MVKIELNFQLKAALGKCENVTNFSRCLAEVQQSDGLESYLTCNS